MNAVKSAVVLAALAAAPAYSATTYMSLWSQIGQVAAALKAGQQSKACYTLGAYQTEKAAFLASAPELDVWSQRNIGAAGANDAALKAFCLGTSELTAAKAADLAASTETIYGWE